MKRILIVLAAFLLVGISSTQVSAQNHYCCLPDGCGTFLHPPCEVDCQWTQTVSCFVEGSYQNFQITCYGRGLNWTIYPTDVGHEGCIPSPDPIVTCSSLPNGSRCTGWPTVAGVTICTDFLQYDFDSC